MSVLFNGKPVMPYVSIENYRWLALRQAPICQARMGILARRNLVGQECPTYVFRSDQALASFRSRSSRHRDMNPVAKTLLSNSIPDPSAEPPVH
jgi:hypothetical protein